MNTFTGPIEAQQAKAASHIKFYALPKLVAAAYLDSTGVPSNTGDEVKYTYWEPFPVTGAPTVEGITPASVSLARRNVTLRLQQYMCWTTITDWINDLHPDNVMEPVLKNLGRWKGETIETIVCNTLVGGLNVLYANGNTRIGLASTISHPLVVRAQEILELADAEKLEERIGPSRDTATQPIAAAFVALSHTSTRADIQNCVQYIPVRQYGNAMAALPNEIGNIEGVRFVLTRFLKPWAAGATTNAATNVKYRSNGASTHNSAAAADVFPIVILAKGAVAGANLNKTKSGQVLMKKVGQADSGDPGGQRGSVSIKFWYGSTILCDLYLLRMEVLCSNPEDVAM